jgi:hypothetical protein
MVKVVKQGKQLKELEELRVVNQKLTTVNGKYRLQNQALIKNSFGVKTKFRKAAMLLKSLKMRCTALEQDKLRYKAALELARPDGDNDLSPAADAPLAVLTRKFEFKHAGKRFKPAVSTVCEEERDEKEEEEGEFGGGNSSSGSSSSDEEREYVEVTEEQQIVPMSVSTQQTPTTPIKAVLETPGATTAAVPSVELVRTRTALVSPETRRLIGGGNNSMLSPRTKNLERLLHIQNTTSRLTSLVKEEEEERQVPLPVDSVVSVEVDMKQTGAAKETETEAELTVQPVEEQHRNKLQLFKNFVAQEAGEVIETEKVKE